MMLVMNAPHRQQRGAHNLNIYFLVVPDPTMRLSGEKLSMSRVRMSDIKKFFPRVLLLPITKPAIVEQSVRR